MPLTLLAECFQGVWIFFLSLKEIMTALKKICKTIRVKLREKVITSRTGKCLFLQNT